ncbi:MAG: hypothetical protein LUG60_13370 [Erysipelotrichaceae bacterium]|nr:hypothetical protein [Erysipelotrichaceae bacterium]
MLRAFNDEDRARWKQYDKEDQIRIDNTELEEAKIEAREQGKKEKDIEYSKLLADNLRSLIKAKFYYVSPYVEKHIVKANFEALNKAIAALYTIHNPDDLIPILES